MLAVASEDLPDAITYVQEKAREGLDPEELAAAERVVDFDADEATCPACLTKFTTDIPMCPECGLRFG